MSQLRVLRVVLQGLPCPRALSRCIAPSRPTYCRLVWQHGFHTSQRTQAKNKVKKGDAPVVSNGATAQEFNAEALESSCKLAISKLQKEIQDLKAGRQNPNILNNLKIASENTTLSTLATVSQKNPKTFLVTVYDPVHVKDISSAIASSVQNLNPQPVPNNPTQLLINIPKDSSSARAEKVKLLAHKAEQTRTQIRFVRGDALKTIKKSQASKDEQKRDEKAVGSLIDKFGKEIDSIALGAKKEMES